MEEELEKDIENQLETEFLESEVQKQLEFDLQDHFEEEELEVINEVEQDLQLE